MAKFKPLNENQLVMLPISLQDQLVPGTLEHTISELVEKHLDLSVFDARYKNDETGRTLKRHALGQALKVIFDTFALGKWTINKTMRNLFNTMYRACVYTVDC